MTETDLLIFREALRSLPFYGTNIKEFAHRLFVRPHTLYNYISGQKPSARYYSFILYTLEKDYPEALARATALYTAPQGKGELLCKVM